MKIIESYIDLFPYKNRYIVQSSYRYLIKKFIKSVNAKVISFKKINHFFEAFLEIDEEYCNEKLLNWNKNKRIDIYNIDDSYAHIHTHLVNKKYIDGYSDFKLSEYINSIEQTKIVNLKQSFTLMLKKLFGKEIIQKLIDTTFYKTLEVSLAKDLYNNHYYNYIDYFITSDFMKELETAINIVSKDINKFTNRTFEEIIKIIKDKRNIK